jgi:hypothetical protein
MANVKVKRGTEGPAHDPYSYTEVTFYFTNSRRKPVIYHGGLGEWTRHGKRKWQNSWGKNKNCAEIAFERLTGMHPSDAMYIPDIIRERKMRKMTKQERWEMQEIEAIDAQMLSYAM